MNELIPASFTSMLVIASALLILASILLWTLRLGITPTPTSSTVRRTISQLLPDDIYGDIYELGSGWGHLFPILRKQYPEHIIRAYERSTIPRWCSTLVNHFFRKKIKILNKNLFHAGFNDAGLVICYLYPDAMTKLSVNFKKQLPEGCWVISHTFHLPGWEPVKVIKSSDLYRTPTYLYQKK